MTKNSTTKKSNDQIVVRFATQNPTIEQLTEVIMEYKVQMPVPSTRKTLMKAIVDAGIKVLMTDSIVPNGYKAIYQSQGGHCGDELAATFASLDASQWPLVAKQNGIDFNRWSHLNNGQQRMNLGNVLRGKLRRGDSVQIGDQTFKIEA